MKRFFLYLSTALLLLNSCTKDCKIKYPKNIKPIDWENYNDVYTVTWNYRTVDLKINNKIRQDEGKDIMIYGWIFQGIMEYSVDPEMFTLINKNENIFEPNGFTNGGTGITIITCRNYSDTINNIVDSLKIKFATTDITKKCFIKGKLFSIDLPTNNCPHIVPGIIITDINDIYFEE